MKNYYVYLLKYPDGKVFYVGKGCVNNNGRDRIDDHEREARGELPITNPHKVHVIRKIWAGGGEVLKEKTYFTKYENWAYEIEKSTIEYYGLSNLTNIRDGGTGGVSRDKEESRVPKKREYSIKQARAAALANQKTWEGFISPFGEEHRSITNLNEWCKDHDLVYWYMCEVDKGKRDHWKGWRKIGSKSYWEDNYDTSVNYNLRLARTYIPSFSLSIDTLPEDIVYTLE